MQKRDRTEVCSKIKIGGITIPNNKKDEDKIMENRTLKELNNDLPSGTEQKKTQWKNEFEENNLKEKKKKKDEELKSIVACNEVINALMKAKEAAELAVDHMDGKPHDDETQGEFLAKNVSPESAHEFLQLMSFLGREKSMKKKRKEEQKSPYSDFTQLNNERVDCLIRLVDENPQALKILLFIIRNMDGYNALVCSYKVLEERFRISHSSVWRHVKYLKDNGYISVQKTGSSNIYILTPELAWKSWGTNIPYCKFPANVMITSSEQDEKGDSSRLKSKAGRVEIMEDKPKRNKEKIKDEKIKKKYADRFSDMPF